MATHFGFFTVIPGTDTPISLTPGGVVDRDLDFHLPPDTTGDPGVLTFMTDAVSPNNLTFTMAINGIQVVNNRVDSTVLHSAQEVVGSFHSGDNKFRIEVTGGTDNLSAKVVTRPGPDTRRQKVSGPAPPGIAEFI